MSIFKQDKCLKSELPAKIVQLMESVGWKNISSSLSTDYYVMQSNGEAGDKNLVFQFRPLAVNGSNDITTTTYSAMSYRLVNGYTPNPSPNTAGTFERTGETWKIMNVFSSTVDPLVEVNFYYSVNKDRLIINIYAPESLNLLPVMLYIGLPTHYTSEPNSRGLCVLTSYAATTANVVHISDNVAELPTLATSTTVATQYSLPPKSPNSAGLHTPCELFYGNAQVGLRGKIDSLFFLPNNSVNDGDILKLGANRYRATNLGISGNNCFPSNTVIYQIS